MRKLVSLSTFALGILVQINSAHAQNPTVQNTTAGNIRGNVTNVERAVNNRASLLERANVQTRGQSQTRVDLTTRNAVDARMNANVNVNANVNATTRGNNAASIRVLPAVGAERLTQGLTRRQSETERLGDLRGRMQAGVEASTRTESQTRGRGNSEQRFTEREGQPAERGRPEILQTRAEVLAEAEARANTSPAERLLVRRLAQIDKMRDTALANGNERQLEQADKLEQLARWQFENRFAARANNPFAEVSTETTLETESTLHPFRMNRTRQPVLETETGTTVETETTIETGTTVETETTTVDP